MVVCCWSFELAGIGDLWSVPQPQWTMTLIKVEHNTHITMKFRITYEDDLCDSKWAAFWSLCRVGSATWGSFISEWKKGMTNAGFEC
jgi:hypothetical protein